MVKAFLEVKTAADFFKYVDALGVYYSFPA
jgi:hypothetical protein